MKSYTVTYTVTYTVPVEVRVVVLARDEETATDVAHELAREHLTTLAVPSSDGVVVFGDLDGIAYDSVEAG